MHNQYQFPSRWPYRIGLLTMIGLLALSAVFYKERTLFADIAYQTVLMIQEGGLQVQVFRFGSAVVHILPYLAIQAEMALEVVLFSYSISFTLLYLGLYLLITRWLKNDYLGLVVVFLFTLTVFDGFYWATSEFQQGLAFTVFFVAFLLRFPKLEGVWTKAFTFLMVPTLVFYHPLIFVPFFFFVIFFLLRNKDLRNRNIYLTIAFFIIVMILKHLFAGNWYDSGKFDQFSKALKEYFPNYLSMPVNKKFLVNSLKYWYLFPVFFFLVEGWYLMKKKYFMAGFVFISCLGYLALIHIGSPNATYRFYIEVSYMPLTLFVMTPFIFDLLPKLQAKTIMVLLIGLFAFRLIAISLNHKPYQERLEWISQKIGEGQEKFPGQKVFVIQNSKELEEKVIISWGVAYESILLSWMKDKENQTCLLVLQRDGQYANELKQDSLLLTTFKQFPYEELNTAYLNFERDTYEWLEE
ncbi:MAG: hypothetical protein DWQ02_03295 [Bacteroidetes bacterium]|nr:MAG: hypothetical protein DWQ02_03295 [Bacteroidota bacterium]